MWERLKQYKENFACYKNRNLDFCLFSVCMLFVCKLKSVNYS